MRAVVDASTKYIIQAGLATQNRESAYEVSVKVKSAEAVGRSAVPAVILMPRVFRSPPLATKTAILLRQSARQEEGSCNENSFATACWPHLARNR